MIVSCRHQNYEEDDEEEEEEEEEEEKEKEVGEKTAEQQV